MITIASLKFLYRSLQVEDYGAFFCAGFPVFYVVVVLWPINLAFFACDFLVLGIWSLIQASKKRTRQSQESAARSLHMEASRRREESRSQCELLYGEHECDIRDRFSRAALEAYMEKYMGDSESPEIVERRATELKALIEKHRASVGVAEKKPGSIDELAKWFIDEKARIEALPLEETMRATHVAHLNMRYAELSQEILESIRP